VPATLQAALLGIVQGATEFLPVSSTAHLILARAFFGFDADAFGLPFDVACHVGTLIAVLIYFRRDIARMIAALPVVFQPAAPRAAAAPGAGRRDAIRDRDDRHDAARLIWLLVIGTIPAVIVGALFNRAIEDHLRTVPVIIVTLAVVGVGLFWADRAGDKARGERTITYTEAFLIGCAQAAALIPGVSRSGATLIAALVIGLRRRDAAEFIFLLSVPAILAAAVHEAPEAIKAMGAIPGEAALIAIGVVTSAIVGYGAVKYFIRYLANHSLDVFAWYRLALAGVAAVWLLRG
jgi:undecaprenyl-diphosphatase